MLVPAVLLVTSGCAFKRPTLAFKTVQVKETDLEGTTLNVVYTLKNPNPIGMRLATVSYALEVEGKSVVSGKPANGLSMKANSSTDLQFPARVKFADIAPVIQTLLSKDQASYKASGEVGLETPIGVLRLPLSYASTFPVPRLPAFAFQSPVVQNVTFTGARIVFPIRISNANGFALPLAGFSANFAIAGANVGTSAVNLGTAIAANESRVVELPLDVNFLQAGVAVANAIRTRSATVKLDGALKSGSVSVPVSLTQTLNFK